MMREKKFKKIIAKILVVAMILTNAGFATLAESVDDVTLHTTQNEETSKTKDYIVESEENSIATMGEADEESSYDNEYSEEPEENETTVVEEPEDDIDNSDDIASLSDIDEKESDDEFNNEPEENESDEIETEEIEISTLSEIEDESSSAEELEDENESTIVVEEDTVASDSIISENSNETTISDVVNEENNNTNNEISTISEANIMEASSSDVVEANIIQNIQGLTLMPTIVDDGVTLFGDTTNNIELSSTDISSLKTYCANNNIKTLQFGNINSLSSIGMSLYNNISENTEYSTSIYTVTSNWETTSIMDISTYNSGHFYPFSGTTKSSFTAFSEKGMIYTKTGNTLTIYGIYEFVNCIWDGIRGNPVTPRITTYKIEFGSGGTSYGGSGGRFKYSALNNKSIGTNTISNFSTLENINFNNCVSNVTTLKNFFSGCTYLKNVTLTSTSFPSVTTMEEAFANLTNLQTVSLENVAWNSITSTKKMFKGCTNLQTSNLGYWDVSNLQNTEEMFDGCTNLTRINVYYNLRELPDTVTNSANMFRNCTNLVGGGGSKYDATKTDKTYARLDYGGILPGYMTYVNNTAHPLGTINIDFKKISWPTTAPKTKSQITNIKFYTDATMGSYDSSVVIYTDSQGNNYMGYIEGNTLKIHWENGYNLNLVADFSGGFEDFSGVTSITGLDKLRTSSLTNISSLFKNCSELRNLDLSAWDIANVQNTGFNNLFDGCTKIESITLSNSFDTTNATELKNVFNNCENLTTITNGKINIINATNVSNIFNNCKKLTNIDLKNSTFVNLTDATNMFKSCEELTTINVSTNVRGLNTTVTSTDMFAGCTNLKGGGGFKYDANHIDGEYARVDYGGILPGYFTCSDNSIYNTISFDVNKTWVDNVAKANITKIVFSNASTIENYDNEFNLKTLDTTLNAKGYLKDTNSTLVVHIAPQIGKLIADSDFSEFFANFINVTTIEGIDVINSTNVTNMTSAFENCSALTSLTLPTNFNTSVVTNMSNMFGGCSALTSLTLPNNFNTSAVTNMSNMFGGCSSLTSLTLPTNFNTNAVTDMSNMFSGCSYITNISGGNILLNAVTNTSNMFNNCHSLIGIDLKGSTFANLNNATNMFNACSNLKDIKVDTNLRNLPAGAITTDMFAGCTNLKGGGGYKYDANHKNGEYARVDYGGILPGYFTCSDDSIYNTISFDVNKTWVDNVVKASIFKIVFSTASTIENYESEFDLKTLDTSINTKGYLKDGGTTLVVHIAPQIGELIADTNWSEFFANFTNLLTIENFKVIDTTNVVYASKAFYNCERIVTIDMTDINIENIQNLESAFEGCRNLIGYSGKIATFSSLVNAKRTFKDCESLQIISFDICDTPTLTTTEEMFMGCTSLARIVISDNYQGIQGASYTDMFKDCVSLVGGQGFGYNPTDPNAGSGEFARIDYGGIMPGYYTLLNPSLYDNVTFNVPTDWFHSTTKNKSDITEIKFYNDAPTLGGGSAIGSYDEMFYIDNVNKTRAYIDGNTVKFHYGYSINQLKLGGDISGLFKDFTNLTTVTGLDNKVDFTSVTNMSELFSDCDNIRNISFNPNTENVTNMEKVFYDCDNLESVTIGSNLKLNKVTNLESAFEGCKKLSALNIGIASFSSVENLKNAFKDCESLTVFSFDICDTPTLATTSGMFSGCKNLRKIYVNDNFQGLQHIAYDNMFDGCINLIGGEGFTYSPTVPECKSGEFARVDYGGIMPGYYTIVNTAKYNDVVFDLETDWYKSATLPKEEVKKIKFFNTSQSEGGMGAYDEMFYMSDTDKTRVYVETSTKTIKFHYGHDINSLKFQGDVEGMFADFVNLESIEGIEKLDASRIVNMSQMFAGCKNMKAIVVPTGLINATTLSEAFKDCTSLETVVFGEGAKVENFTALDGMFENCTSLKTIDFGTSFDISKVTNMDRMFKNCESLTEIKLNQTMSTGNIESMREMFMGCTSLTSESLVMPLASLDISNVKDMGYMFASCSNLTMVDLSGIEANKLNTMEYMFAGCENLSSISFGGNFNTSNVVNMSHMFDGCTNLKGMAPNQNTNRAQSNNFLSNLLRLNDKKYGAGETDNNSKILDLSGLKTDNVVDMQGMFANCNGVEIINLSNINTENVEDMSYMFASCSELRFIVAKDFATSSVIRSENMFMNCQKLMGCEGTKWIDTQVLDDEYAVVDMGPNSGKKGYLTWGNAHIRYSAGKGVYGTMDEDVVVRFSSYKLKKNEFVRKGYIFAGWEDEDGNSYKNESQIVVMNNLNLTPVWRLSSSGDDDSKPGDNGGGGNGGNGGGSSSGPGGGGGGGGNGRGGTLARIGGGGTANIDFIVHTPITMAEHRWTYDDKGERLGVEIRKDSNLGKALANSQNHVSRWQVSTDEDYIKLKNGLYSIEYAGVSFYFGIDDNCKMITGFIQTSENTENRYIDINSGQFAESFTTQSAKYLLYNGDGIYRGILWTVPITINNILYTFDEQGRVIKEENMTATNNALAQENDVSKWEYDPAVNKWKYYFVDENGKGDYYKDGVYSIEYLGNTLYYSFDSNGYMNTGLKEINGNTYYLQETGNFAGSIFVGSISLNGKDYEFDEQGRMVSAMTKTEQ